MTTATERHDQQLAAIKARHAEVARQFADPAVTVIADGLDDFSMFHQVGLVSVYLDPIGRFWTVTVGGEPRRITARMVFDPWTGSRNLPSGNCAPITVEDMAKAGPDGGAVWDGLQHKWVPAPDPDDTQAAQGFKAHEG